MRILRLCTSQGFSPDCPHGYAQVFPQAVHGCVDASSGADCTHAAVASAFVSALEHVDQAVLERERFSRRREQAARDLLDACRVPPVSPLADAEVVVEVPELVLEVPALERLLLDDVVALDGSVANAL